MSARRRSAPGPILVAMTLAVLLGFGLARGLLATDDLRSNLDLFSQVLYLVQNNYVEAPDNEKLMRGAIDGMLRTLDPHTVYLPPKRAQEMDERFQGEYSGIGIQFELQNGVIRVISPLEGTPAHRLGIRAGDRIYEIDGKPLVKTITNDDVFKMLRGPSGSSVQVTIQRDGEVEPLRFDIERAKIPIESIPYVFMIQPGVGYLRIIRFSQTTGDELEAAVTKLKGQGMKSLMIDLRSNSGGLLSQAVDVLDQLVPSHKKVVYTRGRIASANADYYTSERPKLVSAPIVVLIDHGSASASEIVAGTMQDLDRGIVTGVNSYGKGLVQNQLNLSDGSKLLLTIAKYYTPSGRLIQRDYTGVDDQAEYAAQAYREDVPNDSVLATRPKFKTAAGRTVLGGGGILPDVVIPTEHLTRDQADLIQKRVFFEWATRYLVRHKGEKWTPESFGKDFKMSESDWTELRKIANEAKATVADSLWKNDRPFMQQQIRMELAGATLGQLDRYKILIEDDTQVLGALDLFPTAAKLMSNALEAEQDKASLRINRKPAQTTATKPNSPNQR